jgi:hypothetical protein
MPLVGLSRQAQGQVAHWNLLRRHSSARAVTQFFCHFIFISKRERIGLIVAGNRFHLRSFDSFSDKVPSDKVGNDRLRPLAAGTPKTLLRLILEGNRRGLRMFEVQSRHLRFAVAAAALLAIGETSALAQDVSIGPSSGPSTPPSSSAPIGVGASTGPYAGPNNYVAGVGAGNGNGTGAGVGSVSNGQTNMVGVGVRGKPSTTSTTSQIPATCEEYPGVAVVVDCQ